MSNVSCDQLIRVIGEINEKYILEYNIGAIKRKSFVYRLNKTKWLVAASFMVVVLTVVFFIPKNHTSDYKAHIFDSVTELYSVLPERSLLRNLLISDEYEYKFMGTCNNTEIENFYLYENYSSFNVIISRDDHVVAEISLVPDCAAEAGMYAANNSLLKTITINNFAISYGYDEEGVFVAVLTAEDDMYTIHFHSPNEKEFFRLIEDLTE